MAGPAPEVQGRADAPSVLAPEREVDRHGGHGAPRGRFSSEVPRASSESLSSPVSGAISEGHGFSQQARRADRNRRRVGTPSRASERLSHRGSPRNGSCLLYTSDAADEEDSVDLGGRRI